MIELFEIHALDGRVLGRRDDAKLGLIAAEPADAPRVIIAGFTAQGSCLAEVPGEGFSWGGDAELVRIAALIAAEDSHAVTFTDIAGAPLCIAADGVLQIGAHDQDNAAARFKRQPCQELPVGALLGHLAGQPAINQAALTALIQTGAPRLMPLAQALLQLLDAVEARQAWAAVPGQQTRDAFFPLLQAHGQIHLPRFGRYTAKLLEADAARFGWSIGSHTYGIPKLMETGRGNLTIGRFCSLADPWIILGNHNTGSATSYPFMDLWSQWPGTIPGLTDHIARDVEIGNDVWTGIEAIILPGSKIGDGAVIGAGCVVRGSIPPYAICAGNPARIIRYRFEPATVRRLLRLAWWNWPEAMIDRYIPLLLAADPQAFLTEAEAELNLPALA